MKIHTTATQLVMGAAVFVVCGMLAVPAHAQTNLLSNPGFEENEENEDIGTWPGISPNFPCSYVGIWHIDHSFVRTSGVSSITPFEGSQMLEDSATTWTDVYQMVDVTEYAEDIDSGLVTMSLDGWFNGNTANKEVWVTLWAYEECNVNFAEREETDDGTSGNTLLDSNSATWQSVALNDWEVPVGTRYVVAGLHMRANSCTSYADDFTLTLEVSE